MIPQLSHWAIWAATDAEANASIVPNWVKLLITVGVFLVPYGLGVLIARQLKMKEYAFKLFLVLLAAALGIMPFAYQSILGVLEQQHYERELAEYNERKDKFQVTAETLSEIHDAHPRLQINRPSQAKATQISPADESNELEE